MAESNRPDPTDENTETPKDQPIESGVSSTWAGGGPHPTDEPREYTETRGRPGAPDYSTSYGNGADDVPDERDE
jgi:hypothetical protein